MYFSPTTFVAKLLMVVQVLMTLDMPLSTTMALPITSKPIESTVENLAWQAWIELPPEQKQQVKSRKVTPKSIFTLPLRVECPEGHKHVDSKCIPIAIGSNDVLIDLSALGLLVGSTQTEDVYDYDDIVDELSNPLPFGSELTAGEAVKSNDGLKIDLRPPAKDEPLKFNIFQNKFHIFHEEPIEDYGAISNEGSQSSEKEQNRTATTPSTTTNVTIFNDSVSESSNILENFNDFVIQATNDNSSSADTNDHSENSLKLDDDKDFKIEAISVPASGNHSSIQLVTTIMDTETTTTLEDHDKPQESDLTTLLQTESLMPLLNHTTATTLQNPELFSLTMIPLQDPNENFTDFSNLNVDEDITTLSSPIEQNVVDTQTKQEFTRSVTINPLYFEDNDSVDFDDNDESEEIKESTLEIVTIDEPLETTTPIQLDETTIIESHSSSFATSKTQQELNEEILQEEQAPNDFEELLQGMRKGQKDQHVVFKKSKVQPVEVLSTTTETTTTTTTTAAISAASMPTVTKNIEELLTTTEETAAPLFTVHNENENNDRFYNQQLTKQHNEVTAPSDSQLNQQSATEDAAEQEVAEASLAALETVTANTITTTPLTSEIDVAEELRLINELVKGKQKPTTLKTITKIPITTTSTAKPATTTTTTTEETSTILIDNIQSSSSSSSTLSESSLSVTKKPTLTASQIWSKIMPLLTTSTTTAMPKSSANESFSETQQKESNVEQELEPTTASALSSSLRSNRNSKIIRINGFNKISAAKLKVKDITTEASTTTTTTEAFTEESSIYTSDISSSSEQSTTEYFDYGPYWWLPVSWRPEKPTTTERQPHEQYFVQTEEQPLLLRFWSAYTPRSS